MQEAGWSDKKVQAGLQKARSNDLSFAAGQVLGSMCTEPHPLAASAFASFLPTNLGDPAHFPGTAALEQEVLDDLRALLHAPSGAGARLLTGGTEANLLACAMARETTGKRHIVVPDSAHFSFAKAAKLLGMELTSVPTHDHLADPDAMARHADDAALFVAVAGTTELGLVDPVPDVAAAAAAHDVPCHVDAAFGGYVLPFLSDPPPFDLDVEGVTSVGLDPHKMGMAPIPAGALVTRNEAVWDTMAVATDYVSTQTQATLMGTRPGAAAAAVWAVHRRLGRAGYRDTVAACLDTSHWLATELVASGARLVAAPRLNVVTFHDDEPDALCESLADAGFRLNVVPRFGALRIVVNPHVTRAVAERFMEAYRRVRAPA